MQTTSGSSHTAALQLSLPFLWGQSRWQMYRSRYTEKKKKKKKIIKETGRRIILFMDLPNLYLMEVNYVENRICSLQCENQIA